MTYRRFGLTASLIVGFASACGADLNFGAPAPSQQGRNGDADAGAKNEPGLTPGGDAGDDAPIARTWKWLNPTPPANDLNAGFALTPNEAWLVGSFGTALHVKGSTVTSLDPLGSQPAGTDATYHSVWASGADDVWIAGSSAQGSELTHWDGSTWSRGFNVPRNAPVSALWGTARNDVWALVPANGANSVWGIWHWNGFRWEQSPMPSVRALPANYGSGLRAIWGSANDLWAVGDQGAIVHFNGTNWTPPQRDALDQTPFNSGYNYFGIWGAGPQDIWAAFLSQRQEAGCIASGGCYALGFSHWDGATWRVTDELYIGSLNYKRPGLVGARLWGTSARAITALVGGDKVWSYDGEAWRPSAAPPAGNALYGAGAELHAVGAKGYAANVIQGVPADRWPDLVAGERNYLLDVAVAPDGSAFAPTSSSPNRENRVVRWTSEGWNPLPEVPIFVHRLAAFSANQVWAVGHTHKPATKSVATRYDGKSWSAPTPFPFEKYSGADSEIWAFAPNDIWAVSGNVAHYDGTRWQEIPVKFAPGPQKQICGVHGTAPNNVWFVGYTSVFHWDGAEIREVELPPSLIDTRERWICRVFAAGPNDVWIPGIRGAHFDGTRWSPIDVNGDLGQVALWGTGPKDMWILSAPGVLSTAGQESLIRHWDGARFSDSLRVSPRLLALGGDKNHVWAVGEAGATLRLSADPSRSVP